MGGGAPRLDASEWLGAATGAPAMPDLDAEAALIRAMVALADAGLVRSAHDVSAGGIAVTLAESALAGGLGCSVTLAAGRRADEALFGESGGRIVVTCVPDRLEELREIVGDVPLAVIGTVGGDTVQVQVGDANVSLDLEAARNAYEATLTKAVA